MFKADSQISTIILAQLGLGMKRTLVRIVPHQTKWGEAFSYVERHMRFRDFLRAHPAHVKKYEILKLGLAEEFSREREKYSELKAEFIQEILMLAQTI